MSSAAPMASSSSMLQPNAEEYAVFLNRFKLLNLVQRVAHNDVMELVETVGLDALSYKGVRLPTCHGGEHDHGVPSAAAGFDLHGNQRQKRRPAGGGGGGSGTTSGSSRRPTTRDGGDAQRRHRSPASAGPTSAGYRPRRTNQDLRAAAAAADAQWREGGDNEGIGSRHCPVQRQRRGREGHGIRSPEEREAYYSLLAEPRHRLRLDAELPEGRGAAGGGGDGALRGAGFRNGAATAAAADEELHHLFAEFLRSRYGGGEDVWPSPAARDSDANTSRAPVTSEAAVPSARAVAAPDGSAPLWRRLQPYEHGGIPSDDGTSNRDPQQQMQRYPPSSTWPPHAPSGRDETLTSFYRAQQLAGHGTHREHLSTSDSNLDVPPPEDPPRTAPRHGGERQPVHGEHQQHTLPAAPPMEANHGGGNAELGNGDSQTASPSAADTLAAHLSPLADRNSSGADSNRNSASQDNSQLISLVKSVRGQSLHDQSDAISAAFREGLALPSPASQPPVPRLPLSPRDRLATAPTPTPETPPLSRGHATTAQSSNSMSFPSQAQLSTSSGLGGGASRAMGGGSRGLAPKAKPKGAMDSPRVPMDVIRHAASMLSHQPQPDGGAHAPSQATPPSALVQRAATDSELMTASQQQQQQVQTPNSRSRGRVYFASTMTDVPTGDAATAGPPTAQSGPVVRQGRGWTQSPAAQPHQHTASPRSDQPVDLLPYNQHTQSSQQPALQQPQPPPSLVAIAESIDKMLRDHQRILDEVMVQGKVAGARERAEGGKSNGSAQGSSSQDTPCSDDEKGSGERDDVVVDEMLVFSQLHRKVDAMDREMAHIQSTAAATGRRPGSSSSDGYESDISPKEDPQGPRSGGTELPASKRKPQHRVRGTIPAAVVRRLLSYQVEQNECIAFNEKLWNTSNVSQYVFAQRLTNALLEDCLDEVTHEVGGILDEYVDGLADHELQ